MAVLLVQQIAANFMMLLPTCVSTLVLLDQILLTLYVVSTHIYKTPIDYSAIFSQDPCLNSPCQNQGMCTAESGLNYTCNCTGSFIGTNCDSKYNTECNYCLVDIAVHCIWILLPR